MQYYVYVLDMDGIPLMPTTRYGWVRRSLDSGKAVAVRTKPFTIRLTYPIENAVKQDVRIGFDPGRKNIGACAVRADGKCLFNSKVETRNDEIPKLMALRKTHRQASRRGERLKRKRRSARNNTRMKCAVIHRRLPGYKDGTVEVKDIINTESRFNNRKRESGWVTPTVRQLEETHENVEKLIGRYLPLQSASTEINKFDFQKMDNPDIERWEYGHGPLRGHGSVRKALISLQGGKCLLCGKNDIEHDHHIVPISLGGSDALANRAGLCRPCHKKVHADPEAAAKLSKRKEGINKKYHHLSCLNQIICRFADYLGGKYSGKAYVIEGWGTKKFRDDAGFEKDHNIDAYCVAAATLEKAEPDHDMPPCYTIQQFRRHNRAGIKAQVYRSYYLNGKKVAQNRHKAVEPMIGKDGRIKYRKQKFPSLEDWFNKQVEKHGRLEAERMRSALKAVKSYRRYNDLDRPLPGSVFYYEGERHVLSGRLTNGEYYHAVDDTKEKKTNYPAAKCAIYPNEGLVFV